MLSPDGTSRYATIRGASACTRHCETHGFLLRLSMPSPPHGHCPLQVSYALTRKEGRVGTPEKPLSDAGLGSYRAYWRDVVLRHIAHNGAQPVCIQALSTLTGITVYDIVSTLQSLNMVRYWRGLHVVLLRPDLLAPYQPGGAALAAAADRHIQLGSCPGTACGRGHV